MNDSKFSQFDRSSVEICSPWKKFDWKLSPYPISWAWAFLPLSGDNLSVLWKRAHAPSLKTGFYLAQLLPTLTWLINSCQFQMWTRLWAAPRARRRYYHPRRSTSHGVVLIIKWTIVFLFLWGQSFSLWLERQQVHSATYQFASYHSLWREGLL
jgi:hypothetical protein